MFLTLHHALLKDNEKARPVTIASELVFGVFESVLPSGTGPSTLTAGLNNSRCTQLLANGGAIIPVIESCQEVLMKLESIKNKGKQECQTQTK
jgi:hypothetical protein